MSPDDVVSLNLKRARELRNWTQSEAAAQVSRYLGKTWSVQVYGDAERAYRIKRIKIFSATEVIAFCRAFRLPLVWFYLSPDPWTTIAPREGDEGMTGDDLLSLLFPRFDDPGLRDLERATHRLFSTFTNDKPNGQRTAQYVDWVRRQNHAMRTMVRGEFDVEELVELPAVIRAAADQMADLPQLMKEIGDQVERVLGRTEDRLRHEGFPEPSEGGIDEHDQEKET
jgi:hypothetical protein